MHRELTSTHICRYARLLLLVFPTQYALADTETVLATVSEQVSTEKAARQSQQRIDQLDEEAGRLLAEYRQIVAETRSLTIYNGQLENQVRSQEGEMRDIEQQMLDIETTSREVIPLMQRMLQTLERFVGLDAPFLPEERRNRLKELNAMMNRADVTIAEKYRRLLEAYGVEMEYGRTIEAYRAELPQEDRPITVDFLRVGRVALMYQSLDGKRTGYWDQRQKRWVADGDYQQSVRDGLRIAKQQAAPNLLTVPVPKPKETQL